MRRQKSTVRKGRPITRLDTPIRKVKEAEADLARLRTAESAGTEALRHALSAFLASSRAAEQVLRRYSKARFADWQNVLSDEDKWLTEILLEARDLETYEDGPAMGVTIRVGATPSEAIRHLFHVRGRDGVERTLNVVDACTRRVQLLQDALGRPRCSGG
jgi:hypothetical protein